MWTSALTIAIVINELMASNAGSVMSPAVNFDSWIELYNPTEQSVNLSGMYLSDDVSDLTRWQMPADVGTIPAKGYLVVWLGSDDIRSSQAPFKLDCDGGSIYLSDQNGELITSVDYPEAMSRTAYARKTDGGDEWGWTAMPTPGKSNATAKFASERLAAPVVSEGSQLFTGTLNVKVDIPEGATLMYTTDGSVPMPPLAGSSQSGSGDDPVPAWTNWVINGDCEGDDATSLISRDADSHEDAERILNGVGYQGSRGIKIHSSANAKNDWDAQFFVYTPGHVWHAGDRYRFSMKVRADKNARMSVQTHAKPHDYIYWQMLNNNYNVTTEWKEISYEGTITEQQVRVDGTGALRDLQTIAFNLNVDKKDNNFYFDDIIWQSEYGTPAVTTGDIAVSDNPGQKSEDGVFSFNRTTNLTVRLFREGFLPSIPVTRSYIKTTNKYTLPIVSIVGDQKYFTDPKIGLDCDGDGTNGVTGNGQSQPKNYNQNWDRPVNFSYMSPEGEMLFNQDVNIEVSGGWTRSQRFRSFKLKSNKVFDGQNRLDYAFFPQKPYIRNKTLVVRNGGNDVWTHNARFMDPALETIIQRSGMDVDVQSYVPVIEYVNGELRGVLNLREPSNDKFAYANWGYDDEELDAFENLTMKNGTDEVINRIFELGNNATDDNAYNELKTLLDIDEFTNYMAVTMFLDNRDWPNNNIKGYRSQLDGRYRFVSFDLDYAFALNNVDTGSDAFTYFASCANGDKLNKDIVRLLLNLLGRDDYRRKFIDTFCLIGGSVFEPTRAGKIVDELLNNVKAMCQLMKQQGISDGHDPDRSANTIINKLNGRSKTMAGYLKNFSYAKLRTAAQAVTLNTDTEGAHLYVNGLEVPYADFNGHLFAPVELTATAPAGYHFTGWKKGSQLYSEDETIMLPADATVKLTATFAPMSDEERKNLGLTPVRINEVSANDGIYVTEYFKRKDWVELYNTTDQPVDVEGMYFTDNLEKPKKYKITKGETLTNTVIPARGYLIIWCDKKDPTLSQLHATFNIDAEGDELQLMAADGSWTDRFKYPSHNFDQTVTRYPDGSNNIYLANVPTIAKANISTSYLIDTSEEISKGDVDLNGVVDVADLALTINHVLNRVLQGGDAVKRMDMNADGQVNVGDVILIVGNILEQGGTVTVPAETRGNMQATDWTKYTAMQLNVVVPSGSQVSDIRLTGANSTTHQLMWSQTGDGQYTAVVFSLDNKLFGPVDGNMIDVITDGEVLTDNVLLTTPTGERLLIGSLTDNAVTGIRTIDNVGWIMDNDVYDLQGRKVNSQYKKGVYVKKGKKVIK